MFVKSFHFSLKIFVEIMLGIFILVMIGGGFVAWKLSQGTINLDKAIPYITSHINSDDQSLSITSLQLEWQGIENPLGIEAQGVTLSNERGPFLHSPEIDLNISLRSLLLGQLKIEALWIRRIALSITRTEDGSIQMTGQTSTKDTNDQKKFNAVPAIVTLNNLIYDLPELDVLWIDQAKLIYRDLAEKKTHVLDPTTLFVEMHQSKDDLRHLSGFVDIPFNQHEEESRTLKINFATSPTDIPVLEVSATVQETPIEQFLSFLPPVPDGWDFNMMVGGTVTATLGNLWQPIKTDITINAPRGQITFPTGNEENFVDISQFKTHITSDDKNNTLEIRTFEGMINEQASINITSHIKHPDDLNKIFGDTKIAFKNIPQKWFERYWPKNAQDNGAYRWLVKKMQGGQFNSITLETSFDKSIPSQDDAKPLPEWLKSISADFSYEDLTIDYNAPMKTAQNVNGTGRYEDVSLTLDIETALIGGMTTEKAKLYFDDLITEGTGLGQLTFPITAKTQDVFDYINTKPIEAFKTTSFKPKNTTGDVTAIVSLDIPLLKDVPMDDIKVSVDGTITNANIPNAIKGLTLSGGPYKISATANDIKINGSGQLSDAPLTLDMHEYFSSQSAPDYTSKITAKTTANDKIRQAFITDIANYFTGSTPVNVSYVTNKSKQTTIDLNLDLTNTAINVPTIGLSKPSNSKATSSMTVALNNGDITQIKNLKIDGSGIALDKGTLGFKTIGGEPTLVNADLKNMAFNQNRLSVLMSENNNLVKAKITGLKLDARPFLESKKETVETKGNQTVTPMEIGIDVDTMQTADQSSLKNAKAYVLLDNHRKPLKLELDGNLGTNGQSGDVHIRYTPETADSLTLRVESNNAGETLRAFDLYPHIQGGTLQIAGTPLPMGRYGDVRGKARIDNFTVTGAPVLLRLVNALSFENFLNTGDLKFTRLESDFEWKRSNKGDIYSISNGTTSGASVGLTFDGVVDTSKNNMKINGTAAPMSNLNNFVSSIPIIGDLLTGGDGALLAATYSIEGQPDDPSVSVNPLSVLTPGIIRKLLFESKPSEQQDMTSSDAPKRP